MTFCAVSATQRPGSSKDSCSACCRTPDFICVFHCLGIDRPGNSQVTRKMMESFLMVLIQRTRLMLQEFAPHLALLTLPGGYLIALTGLVHRHWPATSLRT